MILIMNICQITNPCISITLSMFHFDKSGNDINDEHLLNNPLILVTLIVFHFDILGNDFNDEH